MDIASWTVVVTSTSNHVPDEGETHDGQSDRSLSITLAMHEGGKSKWHTA